VQGGRSSGHDAGGASCKVGGAADTTREERSARWEEQRTPQRCTRRFYRTVPQGIVLHGAERFQRAGRSYLRRDSVARPAQDAGGPWRRCRSLVDEGWRGIGVWVG